MTREIETLKKIHVSLGTAYEVLGNVIEKDKKNPLENNLLKQIKGILDDASTLIGNIIGLNKEASSASGGGCQRMRGILSLNEKEENLLS